MFDLAGKVAIVSGGASGIGEAVTRLFHRAGAHVIVTDIDSARGEAIAAEMGVTYVAADVRSPEAWTSVVDGAIATQGCVDVLVNNAGTTFPKASSIVDEAPEGHRTIIDINLTGVWLGMRAVIPQMKAQGSGSIVNISSIDGLVGVAHMTTYTATKFAVTGMTKSVALELAGTGIRVNSIHPGFIETPLVARVPAHLRTRLNDAMSRQPITRMGLPEEIANGVFFFASDMSLFCTGTSLVIDGGHLAGPYRQLR